MMMMIMMTMRILRMMMSIVLTAFPHAPQLVQHQATVDPLSISAISCIVCAKLTNKNSMIKIDRSKCLRKPKWMNFQKSFRWPLTSPPIFGENVVDFWGHTVFVFWHCFTVKYNLNIKENYLQFNIFISSDRSSCSRPITSFCITQSGFSGSFL